MKIKNLLASLAICAGMALPAGGFAQEVDNDFNLYVGGTRHLFDRHKDQVNEEGLYYGAEIPLFNRVSAVLERYEVESDFKDQSNYADLSLNRLGFNYHLNPLVGGLQPYLSLGLGEYTLDPAGFGPLKTDETTYDLGIGLKRDFGEFFIVKGDLKFLHGRQTSDTETVIGISAGITFGGAPRAAPPPAPAPAPQPAVVPQAPVDSDGDGVPDNRDRCPDTPRELAVDADGCPILETSQVTQELLVEFEFDSAAIRPGFRDTLADFAQFMRTYANTEVTIEGHTDSTGPDAYNQGLSERRANAVRDVLINEFGIDAGRISTVGYGESRPIASNDTPAGRERNRRIVAQVSVQVEEEVRRQ